MGKSVFMLLMLLSVQVFAGGVYKCKDGAGHTVFQQTPCVTQSVTGDSEAHAVWREMRALSLEAKNAVASLGADMESIKQCNRAMIAYNGKVDALQQRVDGMTRQFPEFQKAQGYLKDCGMCRASADSYCRKADTYLDQVASKLTES